MKFYITAFFVFVCLCFLSFLAVVLVPFFGVIAIASQVAETVINCVMKIAEKLKRAAKEEPEAATQEAEPAPAV